MRPPRALSHLLPVTRGQWRRARDARMRAYREFGARRGFRIVALLDDLAGRYPFGPVAGASSAQAELALEGTWHGRTALVASALVRPREAPAGRTDEIVVQVTSLRVPVPRSAADDLGLWPPAGALHAAAGSGIGEGTRHDDGVRASRADLREGDSLARVAGELVHLRVLPPVGGPPDLEGPLDVLSRLADLAG